MKKKLQSYKERRRKYRISNFEKTEIVRLMYLGWTPKVIADWIGCSISSVYRIFRISPIELDRDDIEIMRLHDYYLTYQAIASMMEMPYMDVKYRIYKMLHLGMVTYRKQRKKNDAGAQ